MNALTINYSGYVAALKPGYERVKKWIYDNRIAIGITLALIALVLLIGPAFAANETQL